MGVVAGPARSVINAKIATQSCRKYVLVGEVVAFRKAKNAAWHTELSTAPKSNELDKKGGARRCRLPSEKLSELRSTGRTRASTPTCFVVMQPCQRPCLPGRA